MKYRIKSFPLLALTWLTLLLLSNTGIHAQEAPQKVFVRMEVDGLSCPFCSYGLEKKLKKIDGAEKVFIDLQAGEATFIIEKDKQPSKEKLEKIVKDSGFVPGKISFSEIKRKKKEDER